MRHHRLFLCALFAILSLVWLSANAAWAEKEDEHPPAPKDHADHGAGKGPAHEKEPEPPIFTPIRIDLGIWTLVVFFLLLFILSKFAWDPLLTALKKREDRIRSDLEEAQKALFGDHKPANVVVGIAVMSPGYLIEVDAIAVIDHTAEG